MRKQHNIRYGLGIAAIVFVALYLGAIFFTLQSRVHTEKRTEKIESARSYETESRLLLPELLLPMGILLALSASYLIIRRRNEKKYEELDDRTGDITGE